MLLTVGMYNKYICISDKCSNRSKLQSLDKFSSAIDADQV